MMRILIAEDDLTSRMMLAAVLKKSGYDVIETCNGAEAWEVMQQPIAPPLAILDWMMPEMDGPEVVRQIRTLESCQAPAEGTLLMRDRPYIIMLTTRGDKDDIIAGLDAGADDYLAKPFHPGELRARVEVGRRLLEMQRELLQARDALAFEATHDPLTGILNRRAIEAALTREVSRERRNHNGLAVAICDIDRFKNINDTFGHQVGDEVLCGFTHLLGKRLRDTDCLGRFGGEEFLVLATGVKDDAATMFEALRTLIADTAITTRAGDVNITISIGARAVLDEDDIDCILARADNALYQAKEEGRNRVCFDRGLRASDRVCG
ncbi:MAG: diguanylate cyclase [bacterium]